MLRKYSKILSLMIALATTGIVACHPDKGVEPQEYDRSAMLKDIADHVIMPNHAAFAAECSSLANMLDALDGSSMTVTNVEAAQAQWSKVANAWAFCELFNVGQIRDAYIHSKIHTWPANDAFIEQFIAGTDVLNEAYIATKGSSSKGIAAIEYLLFSTGGSAAVKDSLTTSPNAARRLTYLKACGQDLRTVATELNNMWLVGGKNYYATFINAKGTGITASTNMIVNELSALVEKMAGTKLSKPMGKANNNTVDKKLAEAFRSDISLDLIKSDLVVLEAAYHGGADTTTTGIDDNLNAVGAKYDDKRLSDKISEQFVATRTALNNVTSPLSVALDNDKADLETAYQELKKLLVLLKTDVVSDLSITLTWSDNDGD